VSYRARFAERRSGRRRRAGKLWRLGPAEASRRWRSNAWAFGTYAPKPRTPHPGPATARKRNQPERWRAVLAARNSPQSDQLRSSCRALILARMDIEWMKGRETCTEVGRLPISAGADGGCSAETHWLADPVGWSALETRAPPLLRPRSRMDEQPAALPGICRLSGNPTALVGRRSGRLDGAAFHRSAL